MHESKIADVSIFLENCCIFVFFILALYIFRKSFTNYLGHCIHQRIIVVQQENKKSKNCADVSTLFNFFFNIITCNNHANVIIIIIQMNKIDITVISNTKHSFYITIAIINF